MSSWKEFAGFDAELTAGMYEGIFRLGANLKEIMKLEENES